MILLLCQKPTVGKTHHSLWLKSAALDSGGELVEARLVMSDRLSEMRMGDEQNQRRNKKCRECSTRSKQTNKVAMQEKLSTKILFLRWFPRPGRPAGRFPPAFRAERIASSGGPGRRHERVILVIRPQRIRPARGAEQIVHHHGSQLIAVGVGESWIQLASRIGRREREP